MRTRLYCLLSAFKTLGWIILQHTRIAVALAHLNFLLFFGQKAIENSHVPKRQLYAYVANELKIKQDLPVS